MKRFALLFCLLLLLCLLIPGCEDEDCQSEIDAELNERDQAPEQLTSVQNELDGAQVRIQNLVQSLDKANDELDSTKEELASTKTVLTLCQSKPDDCPCTLQQNELEECEEQLAKSDAELSSTTDELTKTEAELDSIKRDITPTNLELAKTKADLTSCEVELDECRFNCSTTDPCVGAATAKCNDGTYSYSKSCRGTCSWHGGVSIWLSCGQAMGCGS